LSLQHPALHRTGDYGTSRRDHSGLMPANLITLAHFSVSSAMNFPNSGGVIRIGTPPRSASRALSFGSVRTALISLFSFSTVSAGGSFGTPTPCHELASYPGTKSPTVGMSGSTGERIVVVTASACNLLVLAYSMVVGMTSKLTCIRSTNRSVTACIWLL